MVASKVSRSSPVHIVFVLDNSSSMGESGANEELKQALQITMDEFESWTKSTHRYFNISLISFGSETSLDIEYADSNTLGDFDFNSLDGRGGATWIHKALDLAHDVLERDEGEEGHYRPCVFVLSDGLFNSSDDEVKESANKIKNMNHVAGEPLICCFALGTDETKEVLKSISTGGDTFAVIDDAEYLSEILPAIGTVTQVGGDEIMRENVKKIEQARVANFDSLMD